MRLFQVAEKSFSLADQGLDLHPIRREPNKEHVSEQRELRCGIYLFRQTSCFLLAALDEEYRGAVVCSGIKYTTTPVWCTQWLVLRTISSYIPGTVQVQGSRSGYG